MNILISIIVLSIIVLVHEFGHFITAKLFKMPVSDFSIGMGTKVISFETSETTYNLRALPLGGYVRILGMEDDSEIENGFNSKPAWQRLIVLIAGICMNFLLAIVILSVSIKIEGMSVVDERAIVGKITNESLNVGILKEGDTIVELDGKSINFWTEIPENLNKKYTDNIVKLKILRDGEYMNVDAKVQYSSKENRSYLGIRANILTKKLSWAKSIGVGLNEFKNLISTMFLGVAKLFTGAISKDEISGPIGIFKVIGETSKAGFNSLVILTALLSINIGVLNLIPLPALDGGRIIFVLFEMIGLKLSKKIEENIHRVGIIFLFALLFLTSINDIIKLFRK